MTHPFPSLARIFLPVLAVCSLTLSSCAYMQTHKNVRERGCYYEGQLLPPPSQEALSLYRKGGEWYLAARKAQFRLKYPVVYDSVFRTYDNEPRHQLLSDGQSHEVVYHPISAGTAAVLQRADGYAELETMAEELRTTPGEWTASLPGAVSYPVRAQIVGDRAVTLLGKRHPSQIPLSNRILSQVDRVLIDFPGTLVYNVSIPFMAPFVFFREFSKNN